MPDYFTALICQYSGAINSSQAENYARSFFDAWYFTLPRDKQASLEKLLPDYLKPKKQNTFGFKRKTDFNGNQSSIFVSRIALDLSKSGNDEAKYVISGIMKSLKVISSPEQKFAYAKLLDNNLYELFVRA